MKLSIVIPCFNEKDTIEKVVKRVLECADFLLESEVIIVDDCSTDGTSEILKNRLFSKVSKVLYHEKNMGKGAAIRTGLLKTTGDIIIIQDADFEYDPGDYSKLIRSISRKQGRCCVRLKVRWW